MYAFGDPAHQGEICFTLYYRRKLNQINAKFRVNLLVEVIVAIVAQVISADPTVSPGGRP